MTFQANIPLATDLISVSQGDLKNNFGALNTAWNVDHVAFNSAGAGDHKKITLLAPIANPNQTTPIASIFTKASPTTITSDLYYQDGALAGNVKQLTGGGITTAAYIQFVSSTATVTASYNATVVRNSIGNYTITFPRSFTSTNYLPSITGDATGHLGIAFSGYGYATGTFSFLAKSQTGALVDPQTIACLFFGTLA
jgi:hypothetical protein